MCKESMDFMETLSGDDFIVVGHYKDGFSRLIDIRNMQYRGTKKRSDVYERACSFELSNKLKESWSSTFLLYALHPLSNVGLLYV